MARIYDLLKQQALRYLPEPWLEALKARHYRRALEQFDENEEPDMKVVRFLVPAGTTAIDLGANVGIYTKLLSGLVGPSGRVLSVEPIPETFAILSKNIRALRMNNVTLIEAAVSDSEGMATMQIPEYPSGGRNFYEATIVKEEADARATAGVRSARVRTTTLDSIVREASSVAFVKCDVEGHEAACLSGARAVLREHHPAWLIEISGNPDTPGASAATLVEHLSTFGYAPWLLDKSRLRVRRPGDRSTNYFFLTSAHVEQLHSRAPELLRAG